MSTTVVHVNSPEWAQAVADGRAVYIGRAVPRRGFKASKWGNPYRVIAGMSLNDVISHYRSYVLGRVDLANALPELRGKVLGCWCKPKPCHGDVLAELVNGTTKG